MIDTILNQRYQVQEQLGKQPGRRTFLALDLESEDLVVIKILLIDRDFAWEKLKLFEREAITLKHLNHPAIPEYLDYFEIDLPDGKGFALVQEYIDAPSLETHIENGRNFTEADLEDIAGAILEILIYLHQLQPPIIHRDIKPSNILLTNNRSGNSLGEIFLVDFGSVQNSASIDRGTITIVGTYGYMPPEQFGGRTVPASDLYGLGATLIYLATGQNPADLPQKNLQVQLDRITNLTPSFQAWLHKAMASDLEKRFPSAEKALELLENSWVEVAQPNRLNPTGSRIDFTEAVDGIKVSVFPDANIKSYYRRQKSNPFKNKLIVTYLTAFPAILRSVPKLGFYANTILLGTIILAAILATIYHVEITNIELRYYQRFFAIAFLISVTTQILQWITNYLLAKYLVKGLTIDSHEISASQSIFGCQIEISNILLDMPPPSPLESVSKVQVVHTVDYQIAKKYKNLKNSSLGIWAGEIKYEIDALTANEAEWLGSELSRWLEVPIQYRQITIK